MSANIYTPKDVDYLKSIVNSDGSFKLDISSVQHSRYQRLEKAGIIDEHKHELTERGMNLLADYLAEMKRKQNANETRMQARTAMKAEAAKELRKWIDFLVGDSPETRVFVSLSFHKYVNEDLDNEDRIERFEFDVELGFFRVRFRSDVGQYMISLAEQYLFEAKKMQEFINQAHTVQTLAMMLNSELKAGKHDIVVEGDAHGDSTNS